MVTSPFIKTGLRSQWSTSVHSWVKWRTCSTKWSTKHIFWDRAVNISLFGGFCVDFSFMNSNSSSAHVNTSNIYSIWPVESQRNVLRFCTANFFFLIFCISKMSIPPMFSVSIFHTLQLILTLFHFQFKLSLKLPFSSKNMYKIALYSYSNHCYRGFG